MIDRQETDTYSLSCGAFLRQLPLGVLCLDQADVRCQALTLGFPRGWQGTQMLVPLLNASAGAHLAGRHPLRHGVS